VGWGNNANGQTTAPTNVNVINVPIQLSGSVNTNSPGAYTLVYSATNNASATGLATRTVFVIDTTPPTVVVSNRTVNATGADGAVVTFAPTVSDLCDPSPVMNCVPPSGSVFPIGTTTVSCTGSDASGNAFSNSFTVTVQQIYSYSDGIPDWWRQQYFGTIVTNGNSCANCDADGTGQPNLFKYVAGLNPTNPASVFTLNLALTPGQPGSRDLIFGPISAGRNYTPQFFTNAGGAFVDLNTTVNLPTNAARFTLTDTNAGVPAKFYRMKIALP
jgi:hypothetical protein